MDLGCDSMCIKDMAALLKPQPAYDIVKAIKDDLGQDVRVHVHCHATTGVTLVSLMKAIEAGADVVDTAISSLSLGPGHNPTESLVEMLYGTPFTTNLDDDRLLRIKDHFAEVRPRYTQFMSKITGVETEIFKSQIPGGMISNMESQLRQQGAGDRLKEVLEEVPRVREVAGLPAAGHPVVADRGHPGGVQRADGPLQGAHRRVRRPDAGLLRRHARRAGPRDRRGRPRADEEGADQRAAGRSAPARVGPAAPRRPTPCRVPTAPTRTS